MRLESLLIRTWLRAGRVLGRLPTVVLIPVLILLGIAVLLGGILVSPFIALIGFVRGLWFRAFPPPATRDISQLEDDNADLDVVRETIQDEGQPLKEHHRRRILHDPRLLPKPAPPRDVWPRPKRKPVMQAAEANRLFAPTLRTRNRRIRDLLTDEAQLERFGLPEWKTERDLAQALEITTGELRHFSIHRDAEKVCHYVTFAIPKRRGGQRLILAPKKRLKTIQRKLLRQLVDRLPVSDQAHGFRTGRSIRSGAEPHVGKEVVLKMDLQDFFPSVTFGRVRGYFIAMGYSFPVATTLAVLMTEAERQPVEIDGKTVHVPVGPRHCVQGAPTSPGLCNAICMRLDRRLSGLARKHGWNYTRYADDLTFSGDSVEHVHTIRRLAKRICQEEGFAVHPDKTNIMRQGRQQSVTGVVVNDVPGLSRKERRKLRAVIHRLGLESPEQPATLSAAEVAGKLAYLHMLNPEQAATLRKHLSASEL